MGNFYPYNHKLGQTIQTDAEGVEVDRAFLAHYHCMPEEATDTAILEKATLGEDASSVTEGLNNPDVPRNVTVKASAAQVTGATKIIKIYGTNFAGEEITEEITPTGTNAAAGNLAFKTITKIDLPARANTPAKQKATVAVTKGAQGAGETVLAFTAAALDTASPKDITVALTADDDTAAEVAAKIAAALNDDDDFSAHFVADSSDANITIESLVYAAQDTSIDLTVETAGTPDITLDPITKDTVEGKAEDKVYIGIGTKIGIPYKLESATQVLLKMFNKSADSGTVTADDEDIEKNVIALNGTPDGETEVDLYIVV
jgi:hypothetical protein